MDRTAVTSSSLATVGYDADTQTLEVEFTETGAVYQYTGVPVSEYNALMNAGSLGQHFNANIKDHYSYNKV